MLTTLFSLDCGPHKQISNGEVTGESLYGGTPNISCNPGYSQIGTATCKANGIWVTNVECRRGKSVLLLNFALVICGKT